MRAWTCLILIAAISAALISASCGAESKNYLQASPDDLRWWRDARFGMFVHWGPVSIKGTEIGWSRGREIPIEEYDSLYKQFNPTEFDAKEWVKIAKSAGMKYIVFTTKHHDGFCEFDSKLTDYKITNSPFKRDIVGELAKACHDAHMRLGFYYSPPDWHSPDYRSANHARYIDYFHGQIKELCTNYGKVDIIWFDGLDSKPGELKPYELFAMIRKLQPHVLINNRATLPGDFDTPEQTIGRFQNARPWESCITIGNQWSYRPNDNVKSTKQCIQTLVRCAGGDGNLLLNVGPMPTGEIEPGQVERLKEVGAWLKKYGRTIYGTRGGPYVPQAWGACTCRKSTVYLHILDWDSDTLSLPPIPRRVRSSKALTGGKPIVRQTTGDLEIMLDKDKRDPVDTIIELKLDGPVDSKPIRSSSGSLAAGVKSSASNVFMKMADYGPDKALDDDDSTRWATDSGTGQAWMEVDLGKPRKISRAVISEAFDRVQEFELQYKDGDAWKTFSKGTTIGEQKTIAFPAVTAQHVRLNILQATEGPTIWEFRLYE